MKYSIFTNTLGIDSPSYLTALQIHRYKAIEARRKRKIESPDSTEYKLLKWNPSKKLREKFSIKSFLP